MSAQLPSILQGEIDSAITALRAARNGTGLGMHMKDIEAAVANILGWVQTTSPIETAADNARDQAVAFIHFIERRGPFLDDKQEAEAAREFKEAEQALQDLAATLQSARPNMKASILGLGW